MTPVPPSMNQVDAATCDSEEDVKRIKAKNIFTASFPQYLQTEILDEVRQKFYSRLDVGKSTYLDYTGGALYPSHIVSDYSKLLVQEVFGNPHSVSPASSISTYYEQQARSAILAFLDADPKLYDVILTPNATGALKIVGECYPFKGKRLLMMMDSHNSVIGIGRLARQGGGAVDFLPMDKDSYTLRESELMSLLKSGPHRWRHYSPGLAIFTGQSNVTGSKVNPAWLISAKRMGWHVALDAAALAPSTPISLRSDPVDFLSLSIYKITGFPTGVGALVVAKTALPLLKRRTFWGGTMDALDVPTLKFGLLKDHAGFEDGTINYLSLPAVAPGLDFVRPLLPTLAIRTDILVRYLHDELPRIKFDDAAKTQMIRIRGPPPGDLRGGSLSLVFYKPNMDVPTVEHYGFIVKAAAKRGISVRGGPCLCNYGGSVAILGISKGELLKGSAMGFVRISLGLVSNFEDCYRFVAFCKELAKTSTYRDERLLWEKDILE